MKIIRIILVYISLCTSGIILLPLTILLAIITAPFSWIRNRNFEKRYHEYLKSLEGKNFFCYNNRKKGRDYISSIILPKLPDVIEPVFLNGKTIESQYEYMPEIFYRFKNYTKFPHLVKIRNGKAIDSSINILFFRCLNQNADVQILLNEVNRFFKSDA